jgi:hypothetical protein
LKNKVCFLAVFDFSFYCFSIHPKKDRAWSSFVNLSFQLATQNLRIYKYFCCRHEGILKQRRDTHKNHIQRSNSHQMSSTDERRTEHNNIQISDIELNNTNKCDIWLKNTQTNDNETNNTFQMHNTKFKNLEIFLLPP